MLEAIAVSKTWRSGSAAIAAVRDVSLAVPSGDTIVIYGPSGSGKTTLLSMLGGLLTPDSGSVLLDGVNLADVPERERQRLRLTRIGFVFQRGHLLAQLTACQNVALVLRMAGLTRRAAVGRAQELLERLGVAALAGLRAHGLSPGESQRVALARALAMHPRVVLADEPTAHLDGPTGERVVTALRDVAAEQGAALVIVTHDERVTRIADRVFQVVDGQLMPEPIRRTSG